MTEYPQYQPPQFPGQFQPAPPRKRHWVRWTLIGVVVLAVAGGAGSAASGGKKHAATVAPKTSAAPAVHATPKPAPTTSEAPPAAIPDPAGTVTGTCAYELVFDNLEPGHDHMGDLNAEVDAENTGNVGIVLAVAVTYPQLGHTAISMRKNVRVPAGQTVTVPFTRPATTSEITRLQDWQSGHDYSDGCTYKGTITDTYGPAH